MDENIKLIIPDKRYKNCYLEAINEFKQQEITGYSVLNVEEGDFFETIENYRIGKNLPGGYVRATYLWLVQGEEFVGEIAIRHSLTEFLERFGGNIGYWIRYSRWQEGMGTKMLSIALKYAKENVGLQKVLITCNDTNIGSARVIEKNGGVLQDKVDNLIEGKQILTRRYWITL